MPPAYRLASERGRRAATRYARSPACSPELAERIEQLVKEARQAVKAGDWRHCCILSECLRDESPTPGEIEAAKVELRALWPSQMCDNCGACCSRMCSPPFMPEHLGGTELGKLPPNVRKDFEDGMKARAEHDWIDGVPCFWLTDELKCKHYQHRPEICREYEVGSESCRRQRDQFNLDVEDILT